MDINAFQTMAADWVEQTFGAKSLCSTKERSFRFYEEATELIQSGGLTEDEAHAMVSSVFARPVEENIGKEFGGAFQTLAVLAYSFRISLNIAANDVMDYCRTNQDRIRNRHYSKELRDTSVD